MGGGGGGKRNSGGLQKEFRGGEGCKSDHPCPSYLLIIIIIFSFFPAAFHTLRECQDSKVELGTKISETRQKIGEKRKHLEDLRGELKILGKEIYSLDGWRERGSRWGGMVGKGEEIQEETQTFRSTLCLRFIYLQQPQIAKIT